MRHYQRVAKASQGSSSDQSKSSEAIASAIASREEQLLFIKSVLESSSTVNDHGKIVVGLPPEIKSEISKALAGLNNKIEGDSNSSGVGFDPFARAEAARRTRTGDASIPDLLPKARIFNVSVQKTDNDTKVISTVNIALKDKRKKYKGFNWLDLPVYKNFIKISTMTIFKPGLNTSPLEGSTLLELFRKTQSVKPAPRFGGVDFGVDNQQVPDGVFELGPSRELEKIVFRKFEAQVGAVLGAGRSVRIVRNGAQRNKLSEELLYEVAKIFFDVYKKYTNLRGISRHQEKSLLNGGQELLNADPQFDPLADKYVRDHGFSPDKNMIEVKWVDNSTKIEIYFFNRLYCVVSCDTVAAGNLGVQNELDALYNGFSNSYLTAKLGQSFEVPHSTTREFSLEGAAGSIGFMSHYSFVDIDFMRIENELLDTGNSFSATSTWSSGGFNNISKEMYPAFSTSPSRIVSVVGDRKLQEISSYHFSDGSQHSGPLYYLDGSSANGNDEPGKRIYAYKSPADQSTGVLSSLYVRRSANNKVDYIDAATTEPSKAVVQYNFGFVFGGTSNGSSLQDMDPDANTNQRMLRDLLFRTGEYSTEQQRREAVNNLTSEYQDRFTSGQIEYSGDLLEWQTGFLDPGWDDQFESRGERAVDYSRTVLDEESQPDVRMETRLIQSSSVIDTVDSYFGPTGGSLGYGSGEED